MPKISGLLLLCLTFAAIPGLLPQPALGADHCALFVYHRFGDDRYPSTNISLEHFRAHLDVLRGENAQVIRVGELVSRLERHQPLPERCAVLTVDDAYRSFLSGAMPLLQEYGYPATLFVSTDAVGGKEFLTWEQLAALRAAGIELGNHSASHAYLLDRLPEESAPDWRARVRADLNRAQTAFRTQLGFEPALFAFPYGEFSPALIELVRELGFRAAAGQHSGVVDRDADRYALPRFPMGGPYTAPTEFRNKLRMRPLPIADMSPESPLLGDQNPPVLKLKVDLDEVDPASLQCYVSGQGRMDVEWLDRNQGVLTVRAPAPLRGRSNKYTLTGRQRDGGEWFWFSKLWVRPGF